ncbi:MAG: hypothetical protein SCK29_00670 [Bacillota bacterium]|nr:hypothetical protein [Bacillota bacterium]MDW7682615.1 hypothetical protein [Bacillota bacterium]
MYTNYEYIIVYRTPEGQQAALYKGMDPEELDSIISGLKEEGCTLEKVEIVRKIGV